MPTNAITPQAPAQTRAADDLFDAIFPRSRQFRVELDYDEAIDFLRRIGEWNEFNATTLIAALRRVDRLIPRCPHDGQRTYTVSVGCEGSPVLYLERYEFRWTEQLSDAVLHTIRTEIEYGAGADEANVSVRPLSCTRGRHIQFRFWWD